MNASQFYSAFDSGWSLAAPTPDLRRLAGSTTRWKASLPAGGVTLAFATNAKTAGLLPHLPGEFRLHVTWRHKVDGTSTTEKVSWFQYLTEAERRAFATLQRVALEKFLAQPDKEPMRTIYNYANDPEWLPRANFDEFSYYFDAEDASAWGKWYGSLVTEWCSRFDAAPESFNSWCWRVLWPDRDAKNAA
jgi:hypothetical protein